MLQNNPAQIASISSALLAMVKLQQCPICGKNFITQSRSKKQYCSGACRVRAHRARKVGKVGAK